MYIGALRKKIWKKVNEDWVYKSDIIFKDEINKTIRSENSLTRPFNSVFKMIIPFYIIEEKNTRKDSLLTSRTSWKWKSQRRDDVVS